MALPRPWITLLLFLAARPACAAKLAEAKLWQERFQWDALLTARDKAARQSADPRLLEVIRLIAQQVAQQALNLQQIDAYTKVQLENLRFAFAQQDPAPSLAVIQTNFITLAKGNEQIRHNLYYLTARVRLSNSQALPDPKLTQLAMLLIAQIQAVQLRLNALYTDSAAVAQMVRGETWAVNDYFRFHSELLLRSVVAIQDSVFSVYNASYELYILSK